MNGLPPVPWYERALAAAVLFGTVALPWLYIGTGIYVAVERPGLTPFVAFVLGSLIGIIGMLAGLRFWYLTWPNR